MPIGTVLRGRSGFFDVDTEEGILRCRMRGRLKKDKVRSDLCVLGDDVEVEITAAGEGVIETVLPRRTKLARRHPGPGGRFREDVLIANLDQLLPVFAFEEPAFHPGLLDRFLVSAEHGGYDAVIVANKADRARDDADREPFREFERIGYTVIYTSTHDGRGIERLREVLAGRITAVAGPSGVGKSSLLNAVEPGLGLLVGEVSEAVHKGRHTTRVASLHRLPGGGFVADTPGIRELGGFRLEAGELDRGFREFVPFLDECAFRDCRHEKEKKCGVRDAVARGEISERRYRSYLRLLDESVVEGIAPWEM